MLDGKFRQAWEQATLSQELKAQIFKLPPSDRLALISAIVESLQDTVVAQPDRSNAIRRMRGLLK